jgi:RNA polymerase sigma-70 factor (ECF subfamily)
MNDERAEPIIASDRLGQDLSDQELVSAARSGQAAAFDALVRRHAAAIYRFVFRLVNDGHAAEDLTQDSFLKAWKSLRRFDPQKSFKVWIFRIARNSAFDWLKKKKAYAFSEFEADDGCPTELDEVPDPGPTPDRQAVLAEVRVELVAALDGLGPKTKSTILLHEIEGLTFQEIALASDESLNTVKSRYLRGIRRLRQVLGKN